MRHTTNIIVAVIGALGYIIAAVIQAQASRDRAELEQQIAALRAQINSSPAPAPSAGRRTTAARGQTAATEQTTDSGGRVPSGSAQTVGPFRISLPSCSRTGGDVTCMFTVTNLSNVERECWLWTSDRNGYTIPLLMDDRDNSYAATDSALGIERYRHGWGHIEIRIPPKISMKAHLKFENVDRSATAITLLRVPISESRDGWATADFQNIVISAPS